MKTILLASDSFKGTLSSLDIISCFKEVINKEKYGVKLLSTLIADGGEGTIDAFSYLLKGKKKEIIVKDSNGFDIKANYFLYDDKAVIEVASAISLPLTKIKNPLLTSSYGVGELIKDAINEGVKEIIIGLGGSSTNDAGAGLVSALGAKFFDKDYKEIKDLSNHNLSKIKSYDFKEFYNTIKDIKFTAMCDVINPLLGPNGATYVFAKQKGAKDDDLLILENNVAHFASLINKDNVNIAKTGAAGGIGYILLTLFKAKLTSGIDTLLDMIDFNKYVKESDIVISGEGQLDESSFFGKAVDGIINRASIYNKDIYLIVGSIKDDKTLDKIKERNIKGIKITNPGRKDFINIKEHAKEDYQRAIKELLDEIK